MDVDELLGCEKQMVRGNKEIDINTLKKMQSTCNLKNSKSKIYFKLLFGNSCHKVFRFRGIILTKSNILLSRIELCGNHNNPSFDPPEEYEWLYQVKGRVFRNEPHLHVIIPEFSDQWAIPLSFTEFDGLGIIKLVHAYCVYCGINHEFVVQKGLF